MLKKYSIHSNKFKHINFLINMINKEIINKNKKYNNNLSELHQFIDKKNINELRIKCFEKINKLDWKNIIKKIALQELMKILGPDIQIQTKINLSIQMPGDRSSILPTHSDSWSSDTPFQINLWLPLTDAFETNSMFVLGETVSLKAFKLISKNKQKKLDKPNKEDFIKAKYGNFVIFNPSLLHGNVLNKTKKTRVSLNVRLKSTFSPQPDEYHQDRKYGTYYQDFIRSDNTNFAIKVLKTGILK